MRSHDVTPLGFSPSMACLCGSTDEHHPGRLRKPSARRGRWAHGSLRSPLRVFGRFRWSRLASLGSGVARTSRQARVGLTSHYGASRPAIAPTPGRQRGRPGDGFHRDPIPGPPRGHVQSISKSRFRSNKRPLDGEIEIVGKSPRLRKIQFAECCSALEEQIVSNRTRVDAVQHPRIHLVFLGVVRANAKLPCQPSNRRLVDHGCGSSSSSTLT
jgi:hypothetical protein